MIKTLVELHEALSKGYTLILLGRVTDVTQLEQFDMLEISNDLRLVTDDEDILYLYDDSIKTLFEVTTLRNN